MDSYAMTDDERDSRTSSRSSAVDTNSRKSRIEMPEEVYKDWMKAIRDGNIDKVRDYAEKQHYDVILLDQMMPGLSGEETLNTITERDLLHGTSVIALTADAIMGARESYLAMGFTDYVSKPVKYAELEKVLKRYIPEEKQFTPDSVLDLPTALIWGYDSEKLKEEKKRLDGIYKCVPVVGKKSMEKYLEKHTPDRIIQVM